MATVTTPPTAENLAERAKTVTLGHDEIQRYSRHLIIPEVGIEGQRTLKAAKVVCFGAGGLGSPVALYLAAAGVGTLGIVEFDTVDFSNLQRQVIHGTEDVGKSKLQSATETIRSINPNVRIEGHPVHLSSENALEIFRGYDLVVDGTDNFPTRYLVNDACVLTGIPNVYASIFRFEGQASVLALPDGPCYRCWYPEPPPPGLVPSCAEGGVLGVLPGIMGLVQSLEAVKLILGIGEPLKNRVLLFDALGMRFRELKLRKNPECPVCGDHPSIHQLIDYQEFCGMRGVEAPAEPEPAGEEITPGELKQWRDRGRDVFVLDVREPHEYQICALPDTMLIPLGDLPQRWRELDSHRPTVVHCRSGARSAKAVRFLQQQGFEKIWNLKGGILAWADEVDPDVPKY